MDWLLHFGLSCTAFVVLSIITRQPLFSFMLVIIAGLYKEVHDWHMIGPIGHTKAYVFHSLMDLAMDFAGLITGCVFWVGRPR